MLTLWLVVASLTLTWGYWDAPEDEPVVEVVELLGSNPALLQSLKNKMRPSVARHVREISDIPVNPSPFVVLCAGCLVSPIFICREIGTKS